MLNQADVTSKNNGVINDLTTADKYSEASIREFYLDTELAGLFFRLGKQQVVWGQADGLKILDLVNPQSYREFILDDFDDSRIPLWMINAEKDIQLGDNEGMLQVLWIPDSSTHEMPAEEGPYAFTSTWLVPGIPAMNNVTVVMNEAEPIDRIWEDSDFGLRLSTFVAGWDLSANYLYHYQDKVVLYQRVSMQGDDVVVEIQPKYERNHLMGGTASNAFGEVTLRSEFSYSSHTFHLQSITPKTIDAQGITASAEFSSVIGLDWQGLTDTLISGQWFQTTLLDSNALTIRDEVEHTFTLLVEHRFLNETIKVEMLALRSLNHADGLVRPKLSYQWLGNVDVWLSGDFFYGQSDQLYGQFDKTDRVSIGLRWGI